MSRAVHQVFDTPELLEIIMLSLHPGLGSKTDFKATKTLLHAQRVNKKFKSTITDSNKLQRTLFFAQNLALAPRWTSTSQPFGGYLATSRDAGNGLTIAYRYTTTASAGYCFCNCLWLDIGTGTSTEAQNVLAGSWRHMYVDQSSYQVEEVSLVWRDKRNQGDCVVLRTSTVHHPQNRNMKMGQMFDLMALSEKGDRLPAYIRGVESPPISSEERSERTKERQPA